LKNGENNGLSNKSIIVMLAFIIIIIIRYYNPRGSLLFFKFSYFKYFLFSMYLYTIVKCIFGILIFIKNRLYKIEIKKKKKYLLYLLPTFIMLIMYIYFIYTLARENILIYTIKVPPKFIGFNNWFPMMNLSIISNIIIIIGIFSWLIYWIFCNKNIKIQSIIILNIITPINIVILYFSILLQFTH
jgi:hypothetical protein